MMARDRLLGTQTDTHVAAALTEDRRIDPTNSPRTLTNAPPELPG
jgi:hypothetical protein